MFAGTKKIDTDNVPPAINSGIVRTADITRLKGNFCGEMPSASATKINMNQSTRNSRRRRQPKLAANASGNMN